MQLNKAVVDFVFQLKDNNNREWFIEHKAEYEFAKQEFEKFANNLIVNVLKFDTSLGAIEAKDCVFRIYRDVRFSKDKTPYKPNFGVYLAKGGRKSNYAGYYFHIEKDSSFVSSGLYMPEPDILKAIREEIFDNVEEFKSICTHRDFRKYFETLQGEKLKSAPQGYPKDWPHIDYLKHKSWYTEHHIPNALLLSDNLEEMVVRVFNAAYPLNQFFNKVITAVNGL